MARTAWMDEHDPSDAEIKGEILRQLMLLGRGSTIGLIDIARELFPKKREKQERIRDVAAQMAVAGEIEILTLRGDPVTEIENTRGQIRFRLVPIDLKKVKIDDEPE